MNLAVGASALAQFLMPRSTQLYPATHYFAIGYRPIVLVPSLERGVRRRFMQVNHLCIIYKNGYYNGKYVPSLIKAPLEELALLTTGGDPEFIPLDLWLAEPMV